LSRTVTIGVVQWLPRCNEADVNLRDALDFIAELAARGCDLVVLPELWPCGYDPTTLSRDAGNAAEPLDGPRGQALSSAARAHEVFLFAGSVPERSGQHLYNTAPAYGPDGRLLGWHRKMHLYTPLGEDTVFTAGDRATVVQVEGIGAVGLSICFDGDHPEYARQLHDLGARVVIAPSAYEVATESWWEVLYPANALANGQWWVMANQCGGELLGKSRVIAPDSAIVAEAGRVGDGDGAEFLVLSVDLEAGIREAEAAAGALWSPKIETANESAEVTAG
jgi:predicted amidohydrolase